MKSFVAAHPAAPRPFDRGRRVGRRRTRTQRGSRSEPGVPIPDPRRAATELSGAEDAYDDLFPGTPATLTEWLGDAGVPGVPPAPDSHQVLAADEVRRGKVPGIRTIKKRLRIAQPKAREVQAYLKPLANQ